MPCFGLESVLSHLVAMIDLISLACRNTELTVNTLSKSGVPLSKMHSNVASPDCFCYHQNRVNQIL